MGQIIFHKIFGPKDIIKFPSSIPQRFVKLDSFYEASGSLEFNKYTETPTILPNVPTPQYARNLSVLGRWPHGSEAKLFKYRGGGGDLGQGLALVRPSRYVSE